jgi:hypothetical protein
MALSTPSILLCQTALYPLRYPDDVLVSASLLIRSHINASVLSHLCHGHLVVVCAMLLVIVIDSRPLLSPCPYNLAENLQGNETSTSSPVVSLRALNFYICL